MKKRIYSSKGNLKFINPSEFKAGIDSGVMIDLIDNYQTFCYYYEKEFDKKYPNIYTHRICIAETKGILINIYGYSEKQSEEEIKKLKKKINLKIIERKDEHKSFEQIVFNIGQKYGLNHKTKFGKTSRDYIIITGFWKEGITPILVTDNAFIKTCRELGMNTIKIPTRNKLLEWKLKRFNKRKRF